MLALLDQQRRVAEEYCQRHHMVLVEVFADEARPGSTVVGREAFDAIDAPPLLSACRRVDLVLGGEHLAEERLAGVTAGFLGVEGVGHHQGAVGWTALSLHHLHHDGLFLPA